MAPAFADDRVTYYGLTFHCEAHLLQRRQPISPMAQRPNSRDATEQGSAIISIPANFAEKGSKRETSTLSNAGLAADAAIVEGAPTVEKGKVTPPRRVPNRQRRTREHLTPQEVDKLIRAASRVGRYGHRDATLILLAYRHGLRVSELVALRWDQIDLEQGLLHIARLKHGVPSTHPLRGPELRALRRLRREQGTSPYVVTTERGSAMTDSSVRKIVARAGQDSGLGFPVHPHMLRHACGFKLANEGHDTRAIQHYLGHRNIQHTVRYTELAADRFKRFWSD